MKLKQIYRLIFLFIMAFALGSLVGKISYLLLPVQPPAKIQKKTASLLLHRCLLKVKTGDLVSRRREQDLQAMLLLKS